MFLTAKLPFTPRHERAPALGQRARTELPTRSQNKVCNSADDGVDFRIGFRQEHEGRRLSSWGAGPYEPIQPR
jgi:hypothetical protein